MSGFDHHCKWLNNCIGQENYRLFLALISLLAASELIFAVFAGIYLDLLAASKLNLHGLPIALLYTSVSLPLAISAVVGVAVVNLLLLNAWLRCYKRMTTYEYIIAKSGAKYLTPHQDSQEQCSLSNLPLVGVRINSFSEDPKTTIIISPLS